MNARSHATRWWWIRHAPVTVNEGRCYGNDDLPCDVSDSGLFGALARRLPEDAVWVTSDLQRTYMTARAIVAAGLPGPDPIPGPGVEIEPALREQNFGAWQGLTYDEIARLKGDKWHRFWLAPAHETPPGGESFEALVDRVHGTIGRVSERHPGRDIIAIGHGGTIRAALGLALRLDPESSLAFSIDNLSVTRLDRFDDGSWRVAMVNTMPHKERGTPGGGSSRLA